MIGEGLQMAGFELINDGIKAVWNPDEKALEQCLDFGKDIAAETRQ